MATDGVKIIDGDLAHDTYWGIINLFDSGADIEAIQKEFPFSKGKFFEKDNENYEVIEKLIQESPILEQVLGLDDFSYEIFITSYALAFWEIGYITAEIIKEVQLVIEKGACVKVWGEEYDPKEGKARQRELVKLWAKINKPNSKARKIKKKKYKQIKELLFQTNDLVTFKLEDGYYRALICSIAVASGPITGYTFVSTTFQSLSKPTPEDMFNYAIIGRRIGTFDSSDKILLMQEGVDVLWEKYPEPLEFMSGPAKFIVGLSQHYVSHKDLLNFKDKFEKVGTLRIKKQFDKQGDGGWVNDFKYFESYFGDIEKSIEIFEQNTFPIRLLCES